MTEPSATGHRVYCKFLINGHPFAIPVEHVKEVHAPTPATPIPGAPLAVVGYVNLRGRLHLVVDPSALLTGEERRRGNAECLIVFRETVGPSLAMTTDRVLAMVTIDDQLVDLPKADEPSSTVGDSLHQIVTGFARLEDALYTLMDPLALCQFCLQPSSTT